MKKGLIISLVVCGVFCLILAVSVAVIGTQLDEAKIQRDEVKSELDKMRSQANSFRMERDGIKQSQLFSHDENESLKKQVGEQLKAIEQLKAEIERARNSHTASNVASPSTGNQASAQP